MRKNINKLVAFAIGISVMSGTAVPVFAADTTTTNAATTVAATQNSSTSVQAQTTKPVLTLDDAIKAAISNDDKLAYDEKAISYRNKINDNKEELDSAMSVGGDTEDFNQDTRDNTLNQLKQQRDFDEDVVIQKVTKAYNDIVTRQIKLDKGAKDLEVKTKQLSYAQLRQSLGLMTSTDLKSNEIQIETLQNTQKSNENSLKDAEYSFKVLTGKDVTQYNLEQDIKYEVFKIDGSVDDYLDNAIDNYLKYKEELIKLNKDYYSDSNNQVTEDYVDSVKTVADAVTVPSKPVVDGLSPNTDVNAYQKYEDALAQKQKYAAALAQRLTYLTTKQGIYTQETTLEENKKKFKDQLRSFYTNILATEDNIKTLKENIELNNKQLSNAKLKYDLGLMTKSDYDTLVVSSKDLDLQLRSLIDNYNTLKEDIQKPWVAFSSNS